MPTVDERLATLEEQIRGFRDDVRELTAEAGRTRTRLHNLEGIASAFVDMQHDNRRKEEAQYQRLGLRIQWLTVVVGLAAVVAAIMPVLLAGR